MEMGDWSGWAQFAGGLGSIGAAWWIAHSQQRAAEKAAAEDRHLRAVAISLSASRELLRVQFQADRLQRTIRDLEDLQLGVVASLPHNWLEIEIPHTLAHSRDQLYVLGKDTVWPLFQLLSTLASYKAWLQERSRREPRGTFCSLYPGDQYALKRYRENLLDQVGRATPGITKITKDEARLKARQDGKASRFMPGMIGWKLWGKASR
ncbi:hypothetical protein [Niveispirillum sp. KHB5.9]|uniref:hypothetical protein n=1 Tax=Niveispirillum sp. KHB5.9 TaxID=3400269 RepID=UPI003A84A445